MSARDIIEAAREVYDKEASLTVTWKVGCKEHAAAVEAYRAAFTPDHVALMEAVCEAVRLCVTANTGARAVEIRPDAIEAVAKLAAYRAEAKA